MNGWPSSPARIASGPGVRVYQPSVPMGAPSRSQATAGPRLACTGLWLATVFQPSVLAVTGCQTVWVMCVMPNLRTRLARSSWPWQMSAMLPGRLLGPTWSIACVHPWSWRMPRKSASASSVKVSLREPLIEAFVVASWASPNPAVNALGTPLDEPMMSSDGHSPSALTRSGRTVPAASTGIFQPRAVVSTVIVWPALREIGRRSLVRVEPSLQRPCASPPHVTARPSTFTSRRRSLPTFRIGRRPVAHM